MSTARLGGTFNASRPDAAPRADARRPGRERGHQAAFEDALARLDVAAATVGSVTPLPVALPAMLALSTRADAAPLSRCGAAPAAALRDAQAAGQAARALAMADAVTSTAATAGGAAGRWHVELQHTRLPLRSLDLQRSAAGQWQVTLNPLNPLSPLNPSSTGAAELPPAAALQRLRDRLTARGAGLQPLQAAAEAGRDDPMRETER